MRPSILSQLVSRHGQSAAFFGICLISVACAGSSPELEYPAKPPAHAAPQVVKETPAPPGAVWRDAVQGTLARGLGAFLQHVEVEPHLDAGKFVGFRIVALRPQAFWDGVDVQVGDVLQSVNHMPIERETQAYAAFQALAEASEIRAQMLRNGAPHQVTVKIIERPGSAAQAGKPSLASPQTLRGPVSAQPTNPPAPIPATAAPGATTSTAPRSQ